jgi:2-polyprenyl-3-methyl-5-hydroxy-6-metoxy-1,4-benzoquinol methylase
MPKTEHYSTKENSYFAQVRQDLVRLLPKDSTIKVLEIGAGAGDTLVFIKQNNLAREVVGVDIFPMPNSNQKNPAIDNFILCNIESDNLPYQEEYFDVVLCGDVVEHLVDPWQTIDKLSSYIKKGGRIIISTPNFRSLKNFYVIYIKGDFKYDPVGGPLDKTHLRFFCKKNIRELVETRYFDYESIWSINSFPEYRFRPLVNYLNLLTFRLFEEWLVSQYIVVGIKK